MKYKSLYTVLLLLAIFVFVAFKGHDDRRKEKLIQDVLIQSLQGGHYKSHPIDDNLSKQVFDEFIQDMDYQKQFYIQSDYDAFLPNITKIDDQISSESFQFFDQTLDSLINRIAFVETFYEDLLNQPFDYEKQEEFNIDFENKAYAKTFDELKDRWRKSLKYNIIVDVSNKILNQENTEKDKTKHKSFKEIEEASRKDILKTHKDWFHRLNQLRRRDRLNVYFNAITSTYDPHSEYFAPKDKETFDIQMSGQFEGIGASLQENNGLIKVVNIIPGSASWRQGELEVNDIILKVAQAENEPVSIVNMRIDDAVKLIRGKKGTEVRLTVQKIDGSEKVVPIIRDVVVFEETYAKHTVLEQAGKRIGYIYLPKFYVNFNDLKGRRCSKDVEQAINQLEKENIDGLILDLRNNGGGSLPDVVDMTGLFIKTGPIVQIRDKRGKIQMLKDYNPAIQYKGPLTVMINTFSASASEILAAAIQDYKRGVIVGANSFGKGTVQQFYNFDSFFPNQNEDLKPLGSLKITTQKFYRINGGSTQLKGVAPDLVLPDSYQYIDVAEREMDNAIEWDEIEHAKYSETASISTDIIQKISKESNKRIDKNPTFDLINQNAHRLKQQQEIKKYTLIFQDYINNQRTKREEAKKFDNISEITNLKILATKSENEILNGSDTIKSAKIEKWHKNLQKDAYLWETANITLDLINRTK